MIDSDLAMETEAASGKIPGITVQKETDNGISVTRVRVESDEGASLIGKPKGNYVTVETEKLCELDDRQQQAFSATLARELRALFPGTLFSSVLAAGIGNSSLTPDALGPRTIKGICVTGHIPDYEGCRVCVLTPGVTGQTGIETMELLSSVTEKLKPELVILIDALCAHSTDRILSTVQLTDAGVVPGSGLNNRRCALNEDTLHTKVAAIGVPTVVHASTIIEDALLRHHAAYAGIPDLLHEEKLVVTPADIDESLSVCARLIAQGINLFLHREKSPGMLL